jgi:membrane protease YdiL (CAAX protease family)
MTGLLIAAFLAGGVVFLWLAQAAALHQVKETNIWVAPFRHDNESAFVRLAMKAAVQIVLTSILFGMPLALGLNPIEYHLSWFLSPPWHSISIVLGLSIVIWGAYQLSNVLMGWMTLAPKYETGKLLKKIVKSFLTPVPLATVEEAVFRGVILGQLLNAFPASRAGTCTAVLVSAAIFSSVHFIRPLKNTILPALGLFALGVVLGIAYVLSGRNCWVPITIHASGVWMVQMLRPFVTYRAPAWLIGYPSYPICGALGLLTMATFSVVLLIVGVGV